VIVPLILLAALLLLANATFVGAEFASVAARRARLQQLASEGDAFAATAIRHSGELPQTLAALQLGISAASIGLGFTLEAIVETALQPVLGIVPVEQTVAIDIALAALAVALVSSLHTLFGEMVPKNLAISAPERVARWLALPTSLAIWLATPFVPLVWGSTRLLLRLLRIQTPDTIEVARSADEIRTMLEVSRAEGTIRDYDERLLSRILSFAQMRVTQVMVEWERVVSVPSSSTLGELERAFAETRRGRLPIRAADGEWIVGYVKSCDLASVPVTHRGDPIPAGIVREVVQVDESATVVAALELMRGAGRHFAVVMGPDGRSRGIVTMRSVIELLITDSPES
jgi:CBS domain containing-hemolysin-like protein